MQSRFKDPLQQDTDAESRPDSDCILAFTKNNHSSLGVHTYTTNLAYSTHIYAISTHFIWLLTLLSQ